MKENVLLDASVKQIIANILNCIYVIVKNIKAIITNQTFLSSNFFL
jgi:hypothetical protein